LSFALPGVRVVKELSFQCELEVSTEVTAVSAVIEAALQQGALRDVTIEDAPLDEVIHSFYLDTKARLAS
jgi:hypothetical protein